MTLLFAATVCISAMGISSAIKSLFLWWLFLTGNLLKTLCGARTEEAVNEAREKTYQGADEADGQVEA